MILAYALAIVSTEAKNDLSQASARQCEVALQAVKSVSAKEKGKVVFNFVDDEFTFQRLTPEMLSDEWRGFADLKLLIAPPSAGLREKFVRSGKLNAVARCPEIKRWLTSKKIRFGDTAANAVVARIDDNERYPAVIYTIGLPAISDDDGSAVRYVASSAGADASVGHAEYLVRDVHGEWIVIATFELFTS